jgi:hypothetical protein
MMPEKIIRARNATSSFRECCKMLSNALNSAVSTTVDIFETGWLKTIEKITEKVSSITIDVR